MSTKVKALWNLLKNVNLYDDDDIIEENQTIDRDELTIQLWSTRLFIVSMIVSVVVLFITSATTKYVLSVTINNPTIDTYLDLHQKYGDIVRCPCSRINLPIGGYSKITENYHPICSSYFVTRTWTEQSFTANVTSVWPMDIRTIIGSHSIILRSFCDLSRSVIQDLIYTLNVTSLINIQLVVSEFLIKQVTSRIKQALSTTASSLSFQFNVLRRLHGHNRIKSGLGTNGILLVPSRNIMFLYPIFPVETVYQFGSQNISECKCSTEFSCTFPSAIYPYEQTFRETVRITGQVNYFRVTDNTSLWIPGIKTGCLPVESFVESTLECYQNQSCLNVLAPFLNNIGLQYDWNIVRIEKVNATLQSLIDNLFLDHWQVNIDMKQYFLQCYPLTCSYSVTRRKGLLVAFFYVLTLIGGLNALLRFLSKVSIRLIFILMNSILKTEQLRERFSMMNRLLTLVIWLKGKLVTWNIYRNQSKNVEQIKVQRYSTRVYASILVLMMIPLSIYAVFVKHIALVTVLKPTEQEYERLLEIYDNKLICECETISIQLKSLVKLDMSLHQICTSDFIEERFWIKFIAINGTLSPSDFVNDARNYFALLESLCILARKSIELAKKDFESFEYVNRLVVPRQQFEQQMSKYISAFISRTTEDFVRSIVYFRDFTSRNHLLSVSPSFGKLFIRPDFTITSTSKIMWGGIPCVLSTDYFHWSEFSVQGIDMVSLQDWSIPGVAVGCSSIDSIMHSTFECWFDSKCISQFVDLASRRLLSPITTPKSLNLSLTRFRLNEKISAIVNELLIEQWFSSANYSSFFAKCAVKSCNYTTTIRDDRSTIFGNIAGIYGGLKQMLHVFIPLFVYLVYKIHGIYRRRLVVPDQNYTDENMPIMDHRMNLSKYIRKLINLNLFEGLERSDIKSQQYGTRIYIVTVIVVLILFLIYTFVDRKLVLITVVQPKLSHYTNLQSQLIDENDANLNCPCSTIAISYRQVSSEFISNLHPICSSDILKKEWIYRYQQPYETTYQQIHTLVDNRQYGASFFTNLQTLCLLANNTIRNRIDQFFNTELISSNLIDRQKFELEFDQVFNEYRRQASADMFRTLQLIFTLWHGNQYLTAYFNNWNFQIRPDYQSQSNPIPSRPVLVGGNCSCAISIDCFDRAFLKNHSRNETFIIPGIFIGCYPIVGLLRSNLQCFYSQSCIDRLTSFYPSTSDARTSPKALNHSISTQFHQNATVNELLKELFIEDYSIQSLYDDYYSACAPSSCSYVRRVRPGFLEILINLLGFYSGITVALRFVLQYAIQIICHVRRKIKVRIESRLSVMRQ